MNDYDEIVQLINKHGETSFNEQIDFIQKTSFNGWKL